MVLSRELSLEIMCFIKQVCNAKGNFKIMQ